MEFRIMEFRVHYQPHGANATLNFARVLAQFGALLGSLRLRFSSTLHLAYLFLDGHHFYRHPSQSIHEKVRGFADVLTLAQWEWSTIEFAARFADRIVLLNHGHVVATGTAAEVLTTDRIRDVFGVEPTFIPVKQSGVHLIFD